MDSQVKSKAMKAALSLDDIPALYEYFDAPVIQLDCGLRCAPRNPNNIPFCCDAQFAIPAIYYEEWEYLRRTTDLWRPYTQETQTQAEALQNQELPQGMLYSVCKGPHHCDRRFRSLSCRQFPFFPYITSSGKLVGLAFEWAFEKVCWVLSNPDEVSSRFCHRFMGAYDALFVDWGPIFKAYYLHSEAMRADFYENRRRIPLLLRDGRQARISPQSERIAIKTRR